MIDQLKFKYRTATNRDEKYKILSILPQSWSATTVANEFDVSIWMAKKTKTLVQQNGILCGVNKKLGSKRLNQTTIDAVQTFYRSDEISRLCPRLREYVIVTDEGTKDAIQRRLILMNLKEAYVEMKNDERLREMKIGFTKFAQLRPHECVLALENYGTHTTCVCQYHQNFKLCFSALKKIGIYKQFDHFRDFLAQAICENPSDECRNCSCRRCLDRISDIIGSLVTDLEENCLLETVTIKQWVQISGK